MPRIEAISEADAPQDARPMLENVRKSLGMVPNMFATLANSPAALKAYLAFSAALGETSLDATVREQLALAVAGENGCDYCASAHTLLGRNAGVDADELDLNLRGASGDPKVNAAIEFAREVVVRKGRVRDQDLAAMRDAGFTEAEIVEVVAVAALNIFTNYFNQVADTEIDFPLVETAQAAH